MKRVLPQSKPLLQLPEKSRVKPVQRLKRGENGFLEGIRSVLFLSHDVLERLMTHRQKEENGGHFFSPINSKWKQCQNSEQEKKKMRAKDV